MFRKLSGTSFLGKTLKYFEECGSTNDVLRSLSQQQSLPEGTAVVCTKQTSGRGQRGNAWQAEPGKSLTFSILFKPGFLSFSSLFYINKVITTGIVHGIEALVPGLELSIKWPNDIYYKTYKTGGILVETAGGATAPEQIIAGIGLNVNQESVDIEQALSLREASGVLLDLQDLLESLGKHIEKQYMLLCDGKQEVLDQMYYHRLYRKEGWHFFDDGSVFKAVVCGVTDSGKLILRDTTGGYRYYDIKELAFV